MKTFTEIKNHINKPEQTFICERIHYEKNHVILKYYSEETGTIADILIPPGSTTIAYYWTDRNYVMWNMFNKDKVIIGTLFHICKDVEITETTVQYLDLILDIWISPDNLISLLDEDELDECIKNGLITDKELALIEKNKNKVLTDYKKVITKSNPDT